jgi:hypothetical protein
MVSCGERRKGQGCRRRTVRLGTAREEEERSEEMHPDGARGSTCGMVEQSKCKSSQVLGLHIQNEVPVITRTIFECRQCNACSALSGARMGHIYSSGMVYLY